MGTGAEAYCSLEALLSNWPGRACPAWKLDAASALIKPFCGFSEHPARPSHPLADPLRSGWCRVSLTASAPPPPNTHVAPGGLGQASPSFLHHFLSSSSFLRTLFLDCLPFQSTCPATLVAQSVKNLCAVRETQVQSLGQEDPLEKGKATCSSILA